MKFFVFPCRGEAEVFSAALWEVYNPAAERDPADVTSTYSEIYEHPGGASWAVAWDERTVRLHPCVDPHAIDAALACPTVTSMVDPEELLRCQSIIAAGAGAFLSVEDFLPACVLAAAITLEQMEAEGWFP